MTCEILRLASKRILYEYFWSKSGSTFPKAFYLFKDPQTSVKHNV